MRFGNLVNFDPATFADELKTHRDLGFDYAEIHVGDFLGPDVPSSRWDTTAPNPDALALPVESACCLLTPDKPVVGPDRNFTRLQDTMQRIAKRAERFGISRITFGSGAARRRPDSVDPELAAQQIEEFVRMAGEIFAHHGLILCVEHLNSGDTNTLTRLTEVRELCDHVALPSVAMAVDSHHYGLERETDRTLVTLGDRVRHVHVAEPIGQLEPGAHTDPDSAFDFETFFCWLRKIGYDERISIEAKWTGPVAERGPETLAHLKRCWHAAGVCES